MILLKLPLRKSIQLSYYHSAGVIKRIARIFTNASIIDKKYEERKKVTSSFFFTHKERDWHKM